MLDTIKNAQAMLNFENLKNLPPSIQSDITTATLVSVSHFTGIKPAAMIGSAKSPEISRARWLAVIALQNFTQWSNSFIAREFCLDHSTVHNIKKNRDKYTGSGADSEILADIEKNLFALFPDFRAAV